MEDIRKLFVSAKLRGYSIQNNKQSRNTVYSMFVNMLIRSYEQSDRAFNAMKLRGFNGKFDTIDKLKTERKDFFISAVILIICTAVIILEVL